MDPFTLTYSLADQNFDKTKSLGIFNVSTQLLENLAGHRHIARLTVLSNSTLAGQLRLPLEPIIEYHNEAIGSRFKRAFWDQWGVYDAARKNGSRWLFLPKGFASFIRRPPFKLAVYIYDAIHDFYRYNYPAVMPRLESRYFTLSLRKTLEYADVIFTDSNFAKGELERLACGFKLPPPLVITAGIGFTRAKEVVFTKRNSLVLLTSSWPHKLTERGISFVERWQKETSFSGNIEFIGSMPANMRLPYYAGWRYHPRLSEARYRQFLAEAKALLFFSAYEGFGMPPVEAMISGTCPVFSDIPVTREVMGDSGFSFLNDSYESFAKAMDKASNVPERQIQTWATELLERHNWGKVVNKITNGLEKANK